MEAQFPKPAIATLIIIFKVDKELKYICDEREKSDQ
jgi:hypothetical protein